MKKRDLMELRTMIRLSMLSFVLFSVIFASTGSETAKLTDAVKSVYCILTGVFPVLVFTLIVLAAVAYGFGNFFGADTRARASTWAMACLTGAIVALVIYLIGPVIIKSLYTGTVTQIDCTV